MVRLPTKSIPFQSHRSALIPWEGLCAAAAERVSAVLSRPVTLKAALEEHDWWAFSLVNTKLNRCDMQMLFIAFDADEQDIEDNTMEPEVQETIWLGDGLSFKIVRDMIPVRNIALSFVTNAGLWVIEGDTASQTADTIEMRLPNGQLLRASVNSEDVYPSLDIGIAQPGDAPAEYLCFAEWNPDRKGRELCIGAYTQGEEEPVYYESYAKGA